MKVTKLIAVVFVLVLLFTACAPKGPTAEVPEACKADPFGCATFAPGSVVKIGMGAPMTGGYASFGIDISQGGLLAAKDAGSWNGLTFELVVEDDQGSSDLGAAVANKFVSDPAVVAVAGHIFSGATASAAPIYEKVGVPMLSPSASNPPLTSNGWKVFNRIVFTDDQASASVAKMLFEKLGVKKLAVMHDGEDYGKGLAELVATKFTELGGEVVASEAVTPKETDFTPVLSTIAAKSPDGVFFGGYVAEGAVITNQMKTTGLENAIFFGCDGTFGADFLDKTGANGEGAFAYTLNPPDTAEKLAFDAAYEAAYGQKPGVLSPYTWNGYDSVKGLIDRIQAVALTDAAGNVYIPRGALVDAVRGLKDFKGISGSFTCSEIGECNVAGPLFMVIKDGAWVPAE
jgi:branched-chain amino acid transport system substrate-binding protein